MNANVTVRQYTHAWKQPSLIARIDGQGKNRDEIVVIGSHLDSIAYDKSKTNEEEDRNLLPANQMPGCDDDGSGAVTLMEAFIGLNGSRAIADEYRQQNKVVHSMMEFDMVGYIKNKGQEHIAINPLNSNAQLINFVKKMVQGYIQLPVREQNVYVNASDHASFGNLS
ncbi:hypothetical protein BKA69DRAFT_1042212 [Paraphysoderma sedebokerense]|nr:hypothetical protein BKA69DRAFT_1042212 [Paraphysoderma sedebokerense]